MQRLFKDVQGHGRNGVLIFDDMHDMITECKRLISQDQDARKEMTDIITGSKRESWWGRSDFPETYTDMWKWFETPWTEGINAVNTILSKLPEPQLESYSTKRKRRYSDDGDEYFSDRFLSGAPDFAEDFHKIRVKGRGPVSIGVPVSISHKVNAYDQLRLSAITIAGIDRLEQQGIPVALYALYGSSKTHKTRRGMMVACKVKGHSDPINMDCTIALTSPWLCRSVIFALFHSFKYEFGQLEDGLGYPILDFVPWVQAVPELDTIDKVISNDVSKEGLIKLFQNFGKDFLETTND